MGASHIPPTTMHVRVTATLAGVAVLAGAGPSDTDPLGQREKAEHFGSLDHALEAIPRMVRERINDHVEKAASA